jgi:glycosyltransferase involved in cell wall biosynthesis
MELTILMPCLDEARTIETCVRKARAFLSESGIDGEVLMADNGSTDGSQALARAAGARVLDVPVRGYGAALNAGIADAHGTFVILGDADDSYDFSRLMPFVTALREGHDIVIGNRFAGGIAPGAMPFLHRYVGNPVLSFLGRLFFRIPIGDFHCGLRGCRAEAIRALRLRTTGMEYASEMIVMSALHGLRFTEVPTTLRKDGRGRPPHLRTWRDGWRHLRFLLIYSPRWLFLYPGLAMLLVGALLMGRLFVGPLTIGTTVLDVHTMLYAGALMLLGAQVTAFALFAKTFAITAGLHPPSEEMESLWHVFTLERGLLVSAGVFVMGLSLAVMAVLDWRHEGYGPLDPTESMRVVIPSVVLLSLGAQGMLGSFLLSMLGIRR